MDKQCNVYQSFSNVDFVCMTLNNWLQFKEGRGNQFQASALLLLFYSIVKIKIREQPFDLCELSRGSSQGLEKKIWLVDFFIIDMSYILQN